jgi:saccharopine dehydrogenase-like NADP-dependent oxidoreductase
VIAVVGAAGTIGRVVCRFLEEWGEPVARRDFRLEGEEHVDARDAGSVRRALDGASVCVNCADYRLNVSVMEAALDAGAHYVDLGGLFHATRKQLELDERFRARELTAILGMGSAPGKTNLLAKLAIEALADEPRSLEIWAATRDPAAAGHPLPITYSAQTLIDELTMRPVVLRDGELVEVEPLSGRAMQRLPEIGEAWGVYTLHSELATLPASYPSLLEASFRLSLPDGLVEKLLALEEERPEPYVQSSQAVAVHCVQVNDVGGARATTITRGGSARSTAEPAAAELAAARIGNAGVHPPERAIDDAAAFLGRLDTELLVEG